MFKRCLLFVLLFVAIQLTACAVEPAPISSFYLLYQEDVCIGPAVLFSSDSLLLTTAVLPDHPETLTAVNKEESIPAQYIGTVSDGGLSLFELEQPASSEPLILADTLNFDNCTYWGIDSQGNTHTGNTQRVNFIDNDTGLLSLTCEDSLIPGTILYNQNGNLVGLVYAALGEGNGRGLAVSNYTIYQAFSQDDSGQAANSEFWYSDIQCQLEANLVHLSWDLDTEDQDGISYIYWIDTHNPYYVVQESEPGNSSLDLLLVPGREYAFWISKELMEDPDLFTVTPAVISIPLNGEVQDHEFTTDSMGIAVLPASETPQDTDALPLAAELNRIMLSDSSKKIYLQVENRYNVSENIQCNLAVSITTPDGACYSLVSGYLYAPEYMNHDLWHIEITSLFRDIENYQNAFPAGSYSVQYFLDDQLGGSFSFDLP